MLLLLLALAACSKQRETVGPPVIAISIASPGASAEVIESSLALPIEQAVAKVAKSIESRCENDHLRIEIEIAPGADPDATAHEVNHALSLVRPQLPVGINPPVITKTRKHDQPLVWLAVRVEKALPPEDR